MLIPSAQAMTWCQSGLGDIMTPQGAAPGRYSRGQMLALYCMGHHCPLETHVGTLGVPGGEIQCEGDGFNGITIKMSVTGMIPHMGTTVSVHKYTL